MPRRKSSVPVKLTNSSSAAANISDDNDTPVKKRRIFSVTHVMNKYTAKEQDYLLKSIEIGETNNIIPKDWKKCKVTYTESHLKLNFDSETDVIVNLNDKQHDSFYYKDLFTSKIFKYDFAMKDETNIVILSLFLCDFENAKYNKKVAKTLQNFMHEFFHIDMSDVYEIDKLKTHDNVDELYSAVMNHRKSKPEVLNADLNVQHVQLLPKLRPYQQDAVRWMIDREKNTNTSESLHPLYLAIKLQSGIEIFYNKFVGLIAYEKPLVQHIQTGGILADEMGLGKTVEVLACILNNPRQPETIDAATETETIATVPTIETQLKYVKKPATKPNKEKEQQKQKLYAKMSPAKKAAQIWYENKLAEMVIKDRKRIKPLEEVQCICGDFTKTGIVLCKFCSKMQHALCMGYRDELGGHYTCPQCWTLQDPLKSNATLIVSPLAISRQWSAEVQRHIRRHGLKVLEYRGIHAGGMLYPTELASFDLVITTYAVLQSEIKFANEEKSSVSLRYAKRYNVPNTPLLAVQWWRLCLDEAQNVECPSSLVSCMARQMRAVHRWAVTGTPIQKNVNDLYGLADYLQLSPYDDENIWNHKLYFPYINGFKQPMIEFLSTNLWRSSKKDVIEQIDIPSQTVEEHWLEFSAVEKFFYSREHESCAESFLTKLKDFDDLSKSLKSIDRKTLNLILAPLLSLRQACTHPYAVRGKYLASKRQVKSMEELLEALIKKNTHDSTESLRAIIASLNGMAGILLLQERIFDAVEKYRDALTLMTKYDSNDFLQIDKLQRIHTLFNLSEILAKKSAPRPAPTLRDDQLKSEYESCQSKYMEKFVCETRQALDEAKQMTRQVAKQVKALGGEEGAWCAEIVEFFIEGKLENELCRRVDAVVTESCPKNKFGEISDVRQILYIITTWLDKISKQSAKLHKSLTEFESAFNNEQNSDYICATIVESAMECHLRPVKTTKRPKQPCLCCVLDTHLKKYECIIFQMNTKINKTHSNQGNWHPCTEEQILKAIYTFGKMRGADENLLKDAESHIKLSESRRKEFKALRKLYTFFDQQVSAQDELNICKIRFRLRNAQEPVKVIQKKRNVLKNLDYDIENKYEFIHVMNEFELDFNYNLLKEEEIINEEKLKKLIGTHKYLETLRKQQYSGQSPDPCPICNIQLAESWSILHCGHCYCLDCIHKLLEQNRAGNHVTCSVCRKKQLRNDISYIKVKGNAENTIDDLEIKGSYSTKIHAIVHQTLKLHQSDPALKVLVFSKWTAVLKVLSDAFTANNISFETVASGNLQERLQRFKDKNRGVTALLMPLNLGAHGLNLIEATHLFLVEPLMNPGEELQAIGRIHRIGQTKATVVHRFLIKATMEENIHNAVSSDAKQWHDNKLTLAQLKDLFSGAESKPEPDTEQNT